MITSLIYEIVTFRSYLKILVNQFILGFELQLISGFLLYYVDWQMFVRLSVWLEPM